MKMKVEPKCIMIWYKNNVLNDYQSIVAFNNANFYVTPLDL